MKRAILFILALLLPSGCTGDSETSDPTETTQAQSGIYAPDHWLENQTAGAVQVFLLEDGADGLTFMGKNPVTFKQKHESSTAVTLFSGENLIQLTGAELDGTFLPGDKDIRVDQQRICYYNHKENTVVFFDSRFQETGHIQLPQNMNGTPVISESMAVVFYCTDSEVRALSLESGINRLIRKQNSSSLSVEEVLLADSVLMCAVTDLDGNSYFEFISAQTGETLGVDSSIASLDVWENTYFLQRQDGLVTECIFTAADGSHRCFLPKDGSQVYSLLAMDSVATVTAQEGSTRLELFDLFDGKRKAEVLLDGITEAYGLTADPEQELVWFLCRDGKTGETLLCKWDGEKSAVTDNAIYTSPRYTLENPDAAGLTACRELASALEERFGVKIFLAKEPLASADYSLLYEHQPSVIQKALLQLEKAMSVFPEDFLKTAAEISDSKTLHIGLVRGLKSKNTGVPDGIAALQYWVNGDAWMALSVGDNVEQLFYHELAHLLDTFVYSKNVAYDEWVKLNPKDFAYDLSYFFYKERGESPYLSGNQRAFIDSYSMTYPKEDRARIFDCALAEGNGELFASKTMQNKLRQLCVGIRNAYGWKKDPRSFPWEQYLEKPLAYTKK